MKTIFLYKSEILNNYLVVCVGKNYNEILKHAEKKFEKEAVEMIQGFKELFIIDGLAKFIEIGSEDGKIFQLILFKDWNNTEQDQSNLLHEIIHYKQANLDKATYYERESEFEAYFIESTFRQLREKLNKKLK